MIGRFRKVSVLPPYQGSEGNNWYRGSADAIYKNLDYVRFHEPEEILILSGDHIYKMEYQQLLDYHAEKDADLTIVFTRVPSHDAHRFGLGHIDNEDGAQGGRLLNYWEKPNDPESDWASMTVLCFKPQVLYEALEQNQAKESFHFGKDIIPWLLEQKYKVYGYKFHGYWGYTRTINEYWQSSMDMLGDEPAIDLEAWGFRTNLDHRAIRDNEPVLMGADADVQNSLIYNGCKVDGTVRNSILFPGVHVKSGAVVENSVIFFKNIISENCRLNKVVSDVNNFFGENVVIGPGRLQPDTPVTLLGWNNTFPPDIQVEEGATIYPHVSVDNWPDRLAAGEVLR
jgi:glucose-1-phosphate adenylyltransferase